MTTRGTESVLLRYSDGAVASGVDSATVDDSQQALESRKITGIVISSDIFDITAPAAAVQDRYRCNVQVGFNSQANQAGVLGTLMNTINVTQQAAVTPAPAAVSGSQNIAIIFPVPVRWAEGVTISMIVHKLNNNGAAATVAMEATCAILYTD